MNILSYFTRRDDGRAGDISHAARQLALHGVKRDRAKIRAKCDEMRAAMGLPKAEWPQ